MNPDDDIYVVPEERPMIYDPNDYDERQAAILDLEGFTFWEEDESEEE